jgi:hypothetical protein
MLRCEKGLAVITFYFYKTDHFVSQILVFFSSKLSVKFEKFAQVDLKKIIHNFQIICNLILKQRTLPSTVTEWNQSISLPPAPPTFQSQAPLLTCCSCWTAAHGTNSSSYSWQPFSHPHTAGINSFLHRNT